MRSKIRKNIFLIIIFTTISFFSASAIYIIENSINEGFSKNDFLTQDLIKLKIDFKKGEEILNLEEDYLLMKEDVENLDSYGVYFKGNLEKTPPIKSGRFFSENDFNKNERLAVIGKGLLEDTTEENGERYYYIKNNYYKVIGVLGDEKKTTTYDYSAYINLDSLINDDNFNLHGEFILDAGDRSKSILEDVREQYKESSLKIEEVKKQSHSSILKLIKEDYRYNIIHIIKVLLILIISILLVTNFWIKDKSEEIGIRRAIGASKLRVSLVILKELITVNIVSFILGYSLYIIISYLKDGYFHFYLISMGIVFIITLFTGLISVIIPLYKANKMQPREIMR